MAEIRISDLPIFEDIDDDDFLIFDNGNTTYKVPFRLVRNILPKYATVAGEDNILVADNKGRYKDSNVNISNVPRDSITNAEIDAIVAN